MTQGIQEQSRTLPAIEPELHLREVCGKMLGADLVPRSDDAAFQERECRFNRVSRDARAFLVSRILFGAMVDRLMLVLAHGRLIGGQFIRDDYVNVGADAFLDVLWRV